MMNSRLLVCTILLAFMVGGQSLSGQDNSRNALDWDGIYSGILPCADCEGIKTDIDLHPEGTYVLARRYLGKDDSLYTEYGTFDWNEQGSMITLETPRDGSMHVHYKVGEHYLIQLDQEGHVIGGNLATRYVLRKVGTGPWITERYWELIELRGAAVPAGNSPLQVPHMILWSGNGKVSGNAGCNHFTGSVDLNAETGRIHFSALATTQMVCPQMELEDQLLEVIEVTDNYTVRKDTLSLNRARMAPLAKFVAVYFK